MDAALGRLSSRMVPFDPGCPKGAPGTIPGHLSLAATNPKRTDAAVRGLITGKDVVLHTFTIVRLWGLPTYVRCLRASLSRRPTTFLAVVHASRG